MAEAFTWYPADSADRDHQDEEIDLDALGNPGGARWAHVTDEGTGGPFTWHIYRHWLWDDIDTDPDAELASGTATSMTDGRAAVEAWIARKQEASS